jgi:hypothetical protein
MSTLDKRLPKNAMLHTMFGDHLSIISGEDDIQSCFFSIFSSSGPLKEPIKLLRAHLIKHNVRMLQTKFGDHPSISSVEGDVSRYS